MQVRTFECKSTMNVINHGSKNALCITKIHAKVLKNGLRVHLTKKFKRLNTDREPRRVTFCLPPTFPD
jgi:hypothetical protein